MTINNLSFDPSVLRPYIVGGGVLGATALATKGTPDIGAAAIVMLVDKVGSAVFKKLGNYKEQVDKVLSFLAGSAAVTIIVDTKISGSSLFAQFAVNSVAFALTYKLAEALKPASALALLVECAIITGSMALGPLLKENSSTALKNVVYVASGAIVAGCVYDDFVRPLLGSLSVVLRGLSAVLSGKDLKIRTLSSGKKIMIALDPNKVKGTTKAEETLNVKPSSKKPVKIRTTTEIRQ